MEDDNVLTAIKWSTVEDKKRFIKQFKLFVKSDFNIHKFPKWFYVQLSMCFGHIAHYNQLGFFDTFFRSIESKIDFIQHCLNGGGYGDPAFTYSDAERYIQLWLVHENILHNLKQVEYQQRNDREFAEYERLKAKYGKNLFEDK